MKKLFLLSTVALLALVSGAAIKEVEWVEFTGTQWINTYYVPTCTDIFEMRVRLASTNTTMNLWCSRGSSTTEKTMTCFAMSPGVIRFDRNGNAGKSSPGNAVTTDRDYTVTANYGTLVGTIGDGTTTTEVTPMGSGDFTPNGMLTVGASHTGYNGFGNFAKMKVYSFRISDKDGNILHEYIPAKDLESGMVGLFDKTIKGFFPGCGQGACNAGAEVGETDLEEEFIGYNVISVAAGVTNTLTAATVAGWDATKPLVKLGGGTIVTGVEMANFAGDIFVREGTYKATNAGSFGTASGRTIVNGGTIWTTVGAPNTWTGDGGNPAYGGEKFFLRGDGYNRQGAVYQTNNGCANLAGRGGIVLEGDVRLGGTQTLEFRYGNVNVNKSLITVAMKAGVSFRLVSLGVSNAGCVNVESGIFGVEAGTGNPGDASSVFTFNDGSTFHLNNTTAEDKRSLVFKAGSKIQIGSQASDAEIGTVSAKNRWSGPISLEGVTPLTFLTRAKPFNVSSLISGDGGITSTGGGYLQLSNAGNTFKGGVSMTGVTGPGDLAVTGGVSVVGGTVAATGSTGIIPMNGMPLTIKNARFGLYDNRGADLPDLVVEGRAIVTGTTVTTTFKSLTKKEAGVLTMFGPAKILGATEIQAGTLRFGTPLSTAGLDWYYQYLTSGSHTKTTVPDYVTYRGVDPTGARYAYQGWRSTSGENGAKTHGQCNYYAGYICVPGEEGDSVDCNFIVSIARNVSVVIDETYVAKVSDNTDDLTGKTLNYKRCVVCPKTTLSAGWHKILIYMGNHWNGSCGPTTCDNPVWGSNFGIGVDWQGRCEAVAENYQKLLDPGDGSFLRTTIETDKTKLSTAAYWPTFQGAVGFGQGAVLDVNDTAPYTPVTIPALKGMPTIRNGEVRVSSNVWTLRASDFADGGAALTVESGSTLKFAAGTTVAFEGDFAELAHQGGNKVRHILTSAGGGTIANLPKVGGRVGETDWRLRMTEDGTGIDLVYEKGLQIIIR